MLLIFFLLGGQAPLFTRRKTQLLNWVCDGYGCGMGCGRVYIFSKLFFFCFNPCDCLKFNQPTTFQPMPNHWLPKTSLQCRDARYTGTVKLPYLLYFKRYDIIILHISVFHTLLFRGSPVGGSASQIAAHPVNVTLEQVNNTMDQTD